MVVGGILTHESNHILTKPGHVRGGGKTEVTKWIHLAENHMRGDFLSEPLNICWISKSICVSLDQSDRHTEVFKRHLWRCDLAIPMHVLYWPIIEHREVFPQNVLGEISQILVRGASREIFKDY
jgi:hypothetical protein